MASEVSDINLRFVNGPYEGARLDNNTGTIRKSKLGLTTKQNCINENKMQPSGNNNNFMLRDSKSPNKEGEINKLPNVPEPNINLSREELLKLLSVFEGELQARDEVIAILKSDRPNNTDIHSRYGLCSMPLNALQRDSSMLEVTMKDQVGEQTQDQLKKIIQHQKESHRKVKQMLLASEHTNQRISQELEEAKKNHQEYINKSEDFVTLLERERERIKIALDQEKGLLERKEKEFTQRMKDTKDELTRLKSLSLMLVEERQQNLENVSVQRKAVAELEKKLKECNAKAEECEKELINEKELTSQLENDLEKQANAFYLEQEDLLARIKEGEDKCETLQAKVNISTQQLKKLKCVEKNLRKTDDQLFRIHEKLEKDEEHENLLEEVELLRQTVKDMQEAEKIYTQAHEEYKEIKNKLEAELAITRQLRAEVKVLQNSSKSHKDFERSVEDTDFKLVDLQMKLDFERKRAKDTKDQLIKMSEKIKDMEEFEKKIEESEAKLKEMRELTARFNDDKEKTQLVMKQLRDKNDSLKHVIEDEKRKVTEVTENLIKESKKCLKFKEKFADERRSMIKEMNQLKEQVQTLESHKCDIESQKQTQAEEANDRLRRQVIMLKTRLEQLEETNTTQLNQVKLKPDNQASQSKAINEMKNKCDALKAALNEEISEKEEFKKQILQLKHQSNNNSKTINTLKGVAVRTVQTQTGNQNETSQRRGRDLSVVRSLKSKYESSTLPRNAPVPDYSVIGTVHKTNSLKRISSSRSWSSSRSQTPNTTTTLQMNINNSSYNKNNSNASSRRDSVESNDSAFSSSVEIKSCATHERVTSPVKQQVKNPSERVKSPIEMRLTHDVSPKKTPSATIRIFKNDKTGQPYIHSTGSDNGIQIKFNEHDTTKHKTVENANKRSSKVKESKTNSSNVRQSKSTSKVSRTESPTLIPKFRSVATTPAPSHVPYEVTRLKRSGLVAAFKSKLEK